jgi:hypothetical protein
MRRACVLEFVRGRTQRTNSKTQANQEEDTQQNTQQNRTQRANSKTQANQEEDTQQSTQQNRTQSANSKTQRIRNKTHRKKEHNAQTPTHKRIEGTCRYIDNRRQQFPRLKYVNA